MAIYFYSTTDKYGYLTNFSRHGFYLDGRYWPTVEHYFQAQKFSGTEYEERVRKATTPREAKRLGNDRSRPLRSDWGQVKNDVMKRAIGGAEIGTFLSFKVNAAQSANRWNEL